MNYKEWPPKIRYDEVMDWYEISKEFLGPETLCDVLSRFISSMDLKEILEDTLSRYSKKEFEEYFELN